MAVYYSKSTDVGAPVLTNTAGGFIALFDYFLVGKMGWTKPFTGAANQAVYKQPAGSNGFYLQVDDTNSQGARFTAFETMTAWNTGTGQTPTNAQVTGGLYITRPQTALTAWWYIIGNGNIFYLRNQWNGSGYGGGMIFGDFVSFKSGDIYNTCIQGNLSFGSTEYMQTLTSSVTSGTVGGFYAMRSYTQLGSSVAISRTSDTSKGASTYFGSGGMPYPNPTDGGLYLSPVWVGEYTSGGFIRGYLPGLWNPLHTRPLQNGDTFTGTGGIINTRSFEAWDNLWYSSYYQMFVETSDTWGGL